MPDMGTPHLKRAARLLRVDREINAGAAQKTNARCLVARTRACPRAPARRRAGGSAHGAQAAVGHTPASRPRPPRHAARPSADTCASPKARPRPAVRRASAARSRPRLPLALALWSPPVVDLHEGVGPPPIPRRIWAVVVDAIDRLAGRRIADAVVETQEGLPLVVDVDAASTISVVPRMIGIFATLPHAFPAIVNPGLRHAVRGEASL